MFDTINYKLFDSALYVVSLYPVAAFISTPRQIFNLSAVLSSTAVTIIVISVTDFKLISQPMFLSFLKQLLLCFIKRNKIGTYHKVELICHTIGESGRDKWKFYFPMMYELPLIQM